MEPSLSYDHFDSISIVEGDTSFGWVGSEISTAHRRQSGSETMWLVVSVGAQSLQHQLRADSGWQMRAE
jgi:hypothetical protein